MKIREANKKDLPDILKLIELETDYHHDIDKYYKPFSEYKELRTYYREQLEDENVKIMVAETEDGKLVGHMIGVIQSLPYLSPKKVGIIDNAFVREKLRRKGFGDKLFNALLKWFESNNIKHIEASVDARNKTGIGAWRKFGFNDYRLRLRKDL